MADTGKQSPLGINSLASLLQNTGFTINSVSASYMGASKTNDEYTFGKLVQDTVLRLLTYSINDGYTRGLLTTTTYNNLISIGSTSIGALGNSKPNTYIVDDPTGTWTLLAQAYGLQQLSHSVLPGPATSGYPIASDTDQGQEATWYPYDTTNVNSSITQWGWIRCHALQAWNEYNYNSITATVSTPDYNDFCNIYMTADGFVSTNNKRILSAYNSNTFLDNVYSNMSDLISADITGVNLSTYAFGNDLNNLGKALDLSLISTYGLPSNLLKTLVKNNAISSDLSLALLASGLTNSDVLSIGGNGSATVEQEQKLYGAFLIITGENLAHVLAPLQCNTQGLTSLADLLNVKKLFPSSYASMTVPVYNSTQGLPTNSKTYYTIYSSGAVNDQLTSPQIVNYVGSQMPAGTPIVNDAALSPNQYKVLPKGFGSYAYNIIPADVAIAAGAFSFTMRQIRNIESVDIQRFSKVISSIETVIDLPLTAGTSKPTNQDSTNYINTLSLGSGPYGTYTMSDLYGCMSGLPYPWELLYNRLSQTATSSLYDIYQQLFLATTWVEATAHVTYTTYMVGPTMYYTVTGVVVDDAGGGYGRGNAPAPVITISNGATATCTIGTDDSTANSDSNGTYGRVTATTLVTSGTDGTSIPTVTIEAPPTSALGGTNTVSGTVGWPAPMNSVVQGYIDSANAEILSIQNNNSEQALFLQTYWNLLGSQLKREQRTRYTALVPVTVPKSYFSSQNIVTQQTFVDSIPDYALDTGPHMNAQTIESICDTTILGGQSILGLMRQERNKVRLQNIGIDQDNNIPAELNDTQQKTLITNGTIAGAVDGIYYNRCNNYKQYTLPAWTRGDTTSVPKGLYNPPQGSLFEFPQNEPYTLGNPGFNTVPNYTAGDITPILNCNPNPVINTLVPIGPAIEPVTNGPLVIKVATEADPNNLPVNLDVNYISSTLQPSSPNVREAIDSVSRCNCDCWID
jgi:hypothetical protein